MPSRLGVGIDIGTTSIKACLVDLENSKVVNHAKETHNAYIKKESLDIREQSAELLIKGILKCIEQFPVSLRKKVLHIAVCGQMHGIMWWNSQLVSLSTLTSQCRNFESFSHLITWEDQRCHEKFLIELNRHSSYEISTGYGIATFLYLIHEDSCGIDLSLYDCCGTIQDFLVFLLSGSNMRTQNLMDETDAQSWGFFNSECRNWDLEALKKIQFPENYFSMLPKICQTGTSVGTIEESNSHQLGFSVDTRISVAMGDHPCSVIASIAHNPQTKASGRSILLNIGTSSQLSVVLTKEEAQEVLKRALCTKGMELRPFFKNQVLLLVASITGGNAFVALVTKIQSWLKSFGSDTEFQTVFNRLVTLGLEKKSTSLRTNPCFFGERFRLHERANIRDMNCDNTSLGDLSASVCRGIIENLSEIFPIDILKNIGFNHIRACGNALEQNELLLFFTKKILDVEVILENEKNYGGAAAGALLATEDIALKENWRN